ncbi:unnamed protein product, partial [Rotaria sp. Silwood2]
MQLNSNSEIQKESELPASFVDEISCNTSSLNLEWRQICDGIVNCQNAADELDCHLLEFNKCNTDEFQCRNGMCIPKEFLFDAVLDCMDLSDEQELSDIYQVYNRCPKMSTMECDERLCRKDEFSCGDGQCIKWSSIIDHHHVSCENWRDATYFCETPDFVITNRLIANAVCSSTSLQIPQLTNTSSCLISLRYLLLTTGEQQLSKMRKMAINNIKDRCLETIEYPERPVFSPVFKMFYKKSRIIDFYTSQQNFTKQMLKRPDLVCFSGSMVCHGIWMTLQKDNCMDYNYFETLTSYPFFPISQLFCHEAVKQAKFENVTLFQSNTYGQLPSSIVFTCPNTSDCISLRRVNDGYADCLYAEDEKNSVYTMTEPFRYRCQTGSSPVQYISFQQLGNEVNECTDGSDEISSELSWSSLDCRVDDSFACWVFRGDGIIENRIKDVRLSFHLYCDTVWDTMDGRDERDCSKWVCARGTYQCNRTSQCIKRTYLCDGEFDCDDGEDELNCPRRSQEWPSEFVCHKSNEHFCITSQYLQDRILNRPCISYTNVGDGKIDCLGGQDERNVFSCSDHTMLGNRFLCDNQTKCLNYTTLCNGVFDCSDRTDEYICFCQYEQCIKEQLACSDTNSCENGRCNAKSNCTCSNETSWFWYPNARTASMIYRLSKRRRPSNYETFCYSHLSTQLTTSTTKTSLMIPGNRKSSKFRPHGVCNRGFYLTDESRKAYYCFCPPSFYGTRCQFNSRRITVRVRFDRYHRFDLPLVIHVLVLLVHDNQTILDHQMFVDIDKDFPSKHTIYLQYPRPRPQGIYSVRFEAYHSTNILTAWEYPISPFSFLPVFRLAKILRFSDRSLPWLCSYNHCQNNGTCYNTNNGQHLCLCQRGWQ